MRITSITQRIRSWFANPTANPETVIHQPTCDHHHQGRVPKQSANPWVELRELVKQHRNGIVATPVVFPNAEQGIVFAISFGSPWSEPNYQVYVSGSIATMTGTALARRLADNTAELALFREAFNRTVFAQWRAMEMHRLRHDEFLCRMSLQEIDSQERFAVTSRTHP